MECQVVYICGRIPARIKHALAELPDTLDETYERILREINKADWEFAHRLFQFVSVASRPLRIEELAELLAVDIKAGRIPNFHEGWRVEDPVSAVMSTCSSLLAIVDGGSLPETDGRSVSETSDNGSSSKYRVICHPGEGRELYARLPYKAIFHQIFFPQGDEDGYSFGKVIQFSHYSVKEFLTSARFAEATDMIPRRYHVSTRSAHTLAAQACLGILLHLDEDVVTSDSLAKWPLAQYAAKHWAYHARFEDVSRDVEDGMKQLFDPNKPHLAICLWICDPNSFFLQQTGQAESPLALRGTPLHYAALWGFDSIVEFLIIERSQDVNSRDFKPAGVSDDHGAAPLFIALIGGHVKAARKIIEHGADITARFNDVTLLHMVSNTGPVEIARMLIERGADVTLRDSNGITALHVALMRRQVEVARMLIERGADVSARDRDRMTPLHMASVRGLVEIALTLIEHGADVTAKCMDRESPLHLASRWGEVETARMLIERGADVTARNKGGETPLHLASRRGQVEATRVLIEHGANVTAQNKDRESPLHLASRRGDVKVTHMLIERGADVAAQNKDGETPLHLASREGQVEAARMLIERGADVAAQNKGGELPLHLASSGGQVEAARMLIEHDANVTAQIESGETPLHLASIRGQLETVRMLIEHGADVAAQNKDGETPLHLASIGGQAEAARMLIECGADVTAQNKDGDSPLHLASRSSYGLGGEIEAAHVLIEHGADVAAQNKHGDAPLHMALQSGEIDVACMLIERGADVTAQNKDGDAPLHMTGTEEVARMLIERGADVTAQNKDGDTPLHLLSDQSRHSWTPPQYRAGISDILLRYGADVNARNTVGFTSFHLASQWESGMVKSVLIEHGADPGEISAPESPPVTSPAQLPRPDAGEMSVSDSPPVTSPVCILADLPIPSPSHSSTAPTPNAAKTDLPQALPPSSQLPSNDVLTVEPHRPLVIFTWKFFFSLSIVAIVVTLSFFMRGVPQVLAIGRGA